jgi:putative tryptophan/tyrosine transport system substrate-binding protein
MRRREFITLVGGAAAAWCSVAGAQTRRKRPVIATFASGTPTQRKGLPFWPSFLNGLRELGYIEGRDFDMVARLGASNDDLQKVAEELVQLDPDVILASASVNALAAKRATSTIPIVVAALGNPAADRHHALCAGATCKAT